MNQAPPALSPKDTVSDADQLESVGSDQLESVSSHQLEADGLGELQALLLAGDRDRIGRLETLLLGNPERTATVADVLLEAMVARAGHDAHFARALRPLVEEALSLSVKKTPLTLAEILFPVFGPAIRRTVAHSLAAASASLSRTIDQTLTLRAIGWRLEAARTGRSFGEVVLLRTLEYRVELAYLIHRESGLVLLHEGLVGTNTPDAGLVSGMLTAIRDFAQDSFNTKENLDQFQLGELTVHVETGPLAVLAVVVRGSPPQELRDRLAQLLEDIHQRSNDALREFDGNPSQFEIARDDLSELLIAAYRGARVEKAPPAKPRSLPRWIAPLIALSVIAAGAALLIADQRERARWDDFILILRGTPGVVLTGVSQQNGIWRLEGLRDPLGVSVGHLLRVRGLPPTQVRSNLRPFASLEPVFVLKRAVAALEPPDTVRLRLSNGGILSASGSASGAWLARAKVIVTALSGVTRFNLDAIESQADTAK